MDSLRYHWSDGEREREFALVHVPGAEGSPYTFGEPPRSRAVEVQDFFIATVPVTQAFWSHVVRIGVNPALHRGPDLPVENVSWNALTASDGFLEHLTSSHIAATLREQVGRPLEFRLPTETEREYAARGGPHWRDGYGYSGSNDVDAVAWYDRRHGDHTQPGAQKVGTLCRPSLREGW